MPQFSRHGRVNLHGMFALMPVKRAFSDEFCAARLSFWGARNVRKFGNRSSNSDAGLDQVSRTLFGIPFHMGDRLRYNIDRSCGAQLQSLP